MIKPENIFDDFSNISGLWIDGASWDGCDLARVSDFIIEKNIVNISVPIGATEKIWSWIESRNVRIFNRFDVDLSANTDGAISNLAEQITGCFRFGATGAMVMVKISDLEKFTDAIHPIKNALFFDHDFVVGLNTDKVNSDDWNRVFNLLNRVQPNAILITATGDKFDASSDFVGRVYAMFEHWNFDGELYLMFGKNMLRFSQVLRLAQKMQPTVAQKIIAFMPY